MKAFFIFSYFYNTLDRPEAKAIYYFGHVWFLVTLSNILGFRYYNVMYNFTILGQVTTLTASGFQVKLDVANPLPEATPITIHYPEGLVYDPDYKVLYLCEFVSNFSSYIFWFVYIFLIDVHIKHSYQTLLNVFFLYKIVLFQQTHVIQVVNLEGKQINIFFLIICISRTG